MRICFFYLLLNLFLFVFNNEVETKWIRYREEKSIVRKPTQVNADVKRLNGLKRLNRFKRLKQKKEKGILSKCSYFRFHKNPTKRTKTIVNRKAKRVKNNTCRNLFIKPLNHVHRTYQTKKIKCPNRRACFLKRELREWNHNWDKYKKDTINFLENSKKRATTYFKACKKKLENNSMISFLWVCKHVLYKKGMLGLTMFIMINSALVSIIMPKFDNLLFNDLSKRKLDNFYSLLFQCILVRVINMILCSSRNYIFMMTSAQCIQAVKSILFEIYINKEYEYYDNIDITSVINKLTIEPHEFSDIIPYYVNPFIRNFFSVLFNFGYIFYLNKRLSTVILSCFLFSSFLSVIYSKLKKKKIKIVNQQKANNIRIALETLNNINIVKLYGTELHEYNKYKTSINTILNKQKKKEKLNLMHMIINRLFTSVTYILIVLNGNILLKQGSLDYKTFTSFFFYINNIYSYINILDYYIDTVDMAEQYKPIVQMLKRYTLEKKTKQSEKRETYQEKQKHSVTDSEPSKLAKYLEPTDTMYISSDKGANNKNVEKTEVLSFKNVFFHYSSNPDKPILKDINFKIYKSTINVIIGKSGGGKSTLLKLILNLYKPSQGNISLYKKPLNTYSSRELFDNITYVEQNSKLLNMTIRENLLYGVNTDTGEQQEPTPDSASFLSNDKNCTNSNTANRSKIDLDMMYLINVSKCCTCHEFISRLPKRYETAVSSKTQLLTSSQVQKICVARALMRIPKVLLLDESTSALDKDNERQMFKNIKNNIFFKDLTIIRITHKKANLDLCDNIFTLKDGFLTKTN